MSITAEHDWQRDTDHPSARALLSFLEADVERGISLVTANQHAPEIPAAVMADVQMLHAEAVRWMKRARDRRIPLGQLYVRVVHFMAAVDMIRRRQEPVH